jgi:N-methylhydantoinase A
MRFAIDTGGTFTDCVFVRDGKLRIVKVASRREAPEEAIVEALGQALREFQPADVKARLRGKSRAKSGAGELDLVCGTTVGTNALLERRGGRVALITTAGFEDVLEIGRQARPKLYDFFVEKPEALVPARARIGAHERLAWDGKVIEVLTDREVRRLLAVVRRENPDAVAVCFLFCFRNPKHEQMVAAALRRAGYLVSVSHEILPEFREYERTSTTVINAYLAPVMSRYLGGTRSRVIELWRTTVQGDASPTTGRASSAVQVRVMQSNGGIISAEKAATQPVTTILSGPAGGVIGALYAAQLAGIEKAITFDMGGTSTDVALLSGEPRTTSESMVAGMPVAVPMLEIHTVGAGGGSIARFDRGGALRVGPESAGAEPGPICYGRGDVPTVTDAHAVLGHFGGGGLLGGKFALDENRARAGMDELRGAFGSVEKFAQGILSVGDAVMEKAIRVISVERGHDPRDYTLIALGGAGGLHACSLAAALEMRAVLLPIFPGGLSALGILRADVVREFSRTVLLAASDARVAARRLPQLFWPIEDETNRALRDEGFAPSKIRLDRRLDMRYAGQAYELTVPAAGNFVTAFHRAHEQRYGYHDVKRAVEIVNVRCRATGITDKPGIARLAGRGGRRRAAATGTMRCWFEGKRETAMLFARENLLAGDTLAGPAVISEYSATSLVPRGWSAAVDSYGQILLRRTGKPVRHAAK